MADVNISQNLLLHIPKESQISKYILKPHGNWEIRAKPHN